MSKISVIIPVFNSEKYLSKCLDSVLKQTFKDFEIICVDDGSTDKSTDIITRYRLKDRRVKLITQNNKGQGEARNRGLDEAVGEYIYFLDSDDFIDETLFESALEIFDKTDIDMFCFNTEVCGNTELRLYKRAKKYAQLPLEGALNFSENVIEVTSVYLWNKLFKKSIIDKYNIRFPNLCYEDIAFSKTYFLSCEKVYFDMRRFHHYTIREDSVMAKNFKSEEIALDHFKNWYEIFKNARKDEQLFKSKKHILEKWFWDYYFMTKKLIKPTNTAILERLEKLKVEYFQEFDDVQS